MDKFNIPYVPRADLAIHKAGGPAQASEILGVSRTTIYRWLWGKRKGGSGGLIPASAQLSLLNSGLGITPDDFWHREERSNGTKEEK